MRWLWKAEEEEEEGWREKLVDGWGSRRRRVALEFCCVSLRCSDSKRPFRTSFRTRHHHHGNPSVIVVSLGFGGVARVRRGGEWASFTVLQLFVLPSKYLQVLK